jgi:hypothetical protein
MRPVELVLPAGALSAATLSALRGMLPGVLTTQLRPGSGFWDAGRALHELRTGGYFDHRVLKPGPSTPPLLEVSATASRALGGTSR